MKTVAVSKLIEAGIDEVFAVFADLESAADRITDIVKLEMLTEGPVAVGTRWRETRIMFKKEATEEMEITAFNPPNGYTVEAESHGAHYRTEITFVAEGEGIKATMSFQATPLTWMAKIMYLVTGPMMRGMLIKCLEKDMADLKRYLETAKA